MVLLFELCLVREIGFDATPVCLTLLATAVEEFVLITFYWCLAMLSAKSDGFSALSQVTSVLQAKVCSPQRWLLAVTLLLDLHFSVVWWEAEVAETAPLAGKEFLNMFSLRMVSSAVFWEVKYSFKHYCN